MVWKLFLESLQMHTQSALSADVVHSEEMIASLVVPK